MYDVIYLVKARKELEQAVYWYEDRKSGLGIRFLSEVEKKLTVIMGQPDRYAIKHKNLREAKVQDFPYTIVYRVDEERKSITITSVFHVKRNPESKY